MEITTRNLIDIERYTNDIRGGLLTLLFGKDDEEDLRDIVDKNYATVAHAFDRATTSALFKHLTSDQQASAPELVHGPLKSSKKPSGKGSGGPKPGSAAAKARATKASQTRAANKAARAAADAQASGNGGNAVAQTSARPTGFGGMSQGPGGAV